MPTPASGEIDFVDLQTNLGGTDPIALNEYYRAPTGAFVPADMRPFTIPTSGTLALSMFYSSPGSLEMTKTSIPNFVSGCANGTYTPTIDLRTYFPSIQLTTGKQFRVTVTRDATNNTPGGCGNWNAQTPFSAVITVGTSSTHTSANIGTKRTNMRIIYTTPYTLQGYGFYSGEGTKQSTAIRFWFSSIEPL